MRSDGLYFSLGGDLEGVSSPAEEESFETLVSYYQNYQ
jgi:hypothetical protein